MGNFFAFYGLFLRSMYRIGNLFFIFFFFLFFFFGGGGGC